MVNFQFATLKLPEATIMGYVVTNWILYLGVYETGEYPQIATMLIIHAALGYLVSTKSIYLKHCETILTCWIWSSKKKGCLTLDVPSCSST
jgi:hypothetical protein